MKLTFLGTSSASSCPLPFCLCNMCETARKSKGKNIRKRSSLLINDDLLVDLGPDVPYSAAIYNIDLPRVKYVLQTHAHSDHFDLGQIVARLADYGSIGVSTLKLIASEKTIKRIGALLREDEPDADIFNPECLNNLLLEITYIEHGMTLNIGRYSITALESLHDKKEDSLIYIISSSNNTILYGTDLLEISESAWGILERFKLDVVILDHTYGRGSNTGGHLDAGQVAAIIKRMKQLHIIDDKSLVYGTHISHEGNDIHEKMEQLATTDGYHIAYDGLTLEI